MQLIATTGTLTTAAGAFQFYNIPQNFAHIEVRFFTRDTASGGGSTVFFRFAPDGINIDYGANYDYHYLRSSGTVITSTGASGNGYMNIGDAPASGSSSGVFGATIATIYDYANPNKFKMIKSKGGWADATGVGYVGYWSGTWASTSPIKSIQVGTANNICAIGSRIDIYGISTSSSVGSI
jgi:hypothetical protein